MRKRYYIFIATHDWDGQLRRAPIPVQWVVVFVVCAVIGASTLLGLAGSYGRMLVKVQSLNAMRSRQDLLERQLTSAQHDANAFKAEVASLGSLASEVSALYNFKHSANFNDRLRNTTTDSSLAVNANDTPSDVPDGAADAVYTNTLNNFQVLETTALSNSLPIQRQWSPFGPGVWQPDRWPVRGVITSSFGERVDPFLGEGAFHPGIDIGAPYGTPVHVTADGIVVYAGVINGYGRAVIVNHGHGIRTLYAHMSALVVTAGQRIDRGEVVGYVGDSGRSTGPHLHYEVRVNNDPVNPYRYLRP